MLHALSIVLVLDRFRLLKILIRRSCSKISLTIVFLFVLFLSREIAEDERVRQVYRLHGIDENTTNFSAPDILKDII